MGIGLDVGLGGSAVGVGATVFVTGVGGLGVTASVGTSVGISRSSSVGTKVIASGDAARHAPTKAVSNKTTETEDTPLHHNLALSTTPIT